MSRKNSNANSSDDGSNNAESDDNESKSSKGSSHHLGATVMHKISSPIENRLRKVVSRHDDSEHSNNSGGQHPIKDVADFFGEGGKAVKRLVHHRAKSQDTGSTTSSRGVTISDDEDVQDDIAVPPDETLEKMNVIINRRLKGVSIAQYYAAAWSENTTTSDKDPLYRSFLQESGKENILVGEWEKAEEGYVGDWDGEQYTQKRTVTFVFDKKIPMQSKPVVAQVTQTHYCRVEGKDKCVVQMTIEMQNVPFSDCFNVEIRWVATKSGANDVVVKVGLYVNFIKSTMLSGKIRSGTTQQTTLQQLQLFEKVQQACGASVEEVKEESKEEQPVKSPTSLSSDEAGRVLVLLACLLLLVTQAQCLFCSEFYAGDYVHLAMCSITCMLAGMLILVPNVCELEEWERYLVVIAHLAQGLCAALASTSTIATSLSTVLLMAAWTVLAFGVWRLGASKAA